MSGAYYNDFDPDVCAVLRELIKRGLIPDGEVDGRSILDVDPADLAGFVQCHFFAGIGGWAYALRLAGWPDDKPVWTGSPPCQPFSVAGKGLAADDPRHLGPAFVRLVRASRPDVLFGEQVASADVFGHVAGSGKRGVTGEPRWTWIDDLFLRLEAARYASWALDYPSASLGAPHIRQRTYFGAVRLADAECDVSGRRPREAFGTQTARGCLEEPCDHRPLDDGATHRLADALCAGWAERRPDAGDRPTAGCGESERLEDSELSTGQRLGPQRGTGVCDEKARGLAGTSDADRVGTVACSAGLLRGQDGRLADTDGRNARAEREQRGGEHGFEQIDGGADAEPATGPTYGPWGNADWLYCRDGRWRPVEPGTFPLAHGVPARVGRLRGYGNAINPWQAAHFVRTTYHGQ